MPRCCGKGSFGPTILYTWFEAIWETKPDMGLTQQEALDLFRSDDLVGIGMAANEVRRKKTDPRVATYQIDRNINYTNFCTEYCSFCAFYRPLGSKEGYLLSFESIYKKIEEMIELGGTGILLQGGLHPDLRIEYYENL